MVDRSTELDAAWEAATQPLLVAADGLVRSRRAVPKRCRR